MSTLIAGFAVWGGIGWLLDQWWGTRLMTPIGLLIGMALGIYAVVARHGRPAPVDRTVGRELHLHGRDGAHDLVAARGRVRSPTSSVRQ